ncbi:MAG: InlB B-repeat-containing protein [Paludibacteraceae bacterium]|nr:InlB B-repeat-containing protein [Paludibacteraceae bacterium]
MDSYLYYNVSGVNYVPTNTYTIDDTNNANTMRAYNGSVGSYCINTYTDDAWLFRTGTSTIINPNHSTTPMYVKVDGKNTYRSNMTVEFGSIPVLRSLTISTAGASGSASISCAEGHGYPSGGFAAGNSGNYYYDGTNVTLVAPDIDGYEFVNWTKGGSQVSTSQSYAFSVSSSKSGAYVANYEAAAPTTYSLTWDPGDGELVGTPGVDYTPDGDYEAGAAIIVPDVTREGYHLSEWEEEGGYNSYSSSDVGSVSTKYPVAENYTASWAPNDYTVTFNGNGSTSGSMANQTGFKYGTSKDLTNNAFSRVYTVTYNYHEATGGNGTASANATYTFNGWNTNADGTSGTNYTNGQSISTPTPAPAHNGTLDLYAKWNSGSVTLPSPEKTGFRFKGWYTDATSGTRVGGAGDSYTPAAGITLHAQWTELVTFTIAPYTNGTVIVNYADNGSQEFTSGSRDIPVGTLVSFSAVANTNYHITTVDLSGSSFSASSAYTLKAGDGTKTLTANFLPDTYAITYNKGANGTGSIDAGEKTYGVNFTLSSSTFTREGYTQTGWSLTDGGNKAYDLGGSYTTNSAQEFFPVWAANTYYVSFDPDEGSGTMTNQTFTYGVAQNLKTNTFTGPAVTVTYDYSDATGGDSPASETVNASFANWTDGDNEYTNGQNVNNLTATNGATVALTAVWDFDQAVTLPSPTKTGYTFVQWEYGDAPLIAIAGEAEDEFIPDEDVTLTAHWNANNYTITYKDQNDAAFSGTQTDAPTTHTYGTATTLRIPTREGYNFVGWFTASNCQSGAVGNSTAASLGATDYTDDITLYAKWELAVVYHTITFNDYNGTQLQTGNVAENTKPSVTDPTRADDDDNYLSYEFVGWRSSVVEDENIYTTAELPNATAEVTYTAVYDEYFRILDDKENGDDYYDVLASKVGQTINVKYERTFNAGRWSTFSLPFGYSYRNEANQTFRNRLYYLVSMKYTADGYLTLNCMPATGGFAANKPHILILPEGNENKIVNPTFKGVTIKALARNYYSVQNMETAVGGSVEFRNTKDREILAKEKNVIYLSNNRLYYPNLAPEASSWLYPFRGYFYLNASVYYTPSRIRLVNEEGEQIETLPEAAEETSVETKKYIENGILIIERAGNKYDAQGHKLN